MRAIATNIKKLTPFKSALILRSLPKFSDPIVFEHAYKEFLSNLNKTRIYGDLFTFPYGEFKYFEKNTIYNLVQSVHNTFKEKNLLNVHGYNSMLNCYLVHEINVDINVMLKSMKECDIIPNNTTFSVLIDLCCKQGDLVSALDILEELKLRQVKLSNDLNISIYRVYITTGQFDKAEQFIKEQNMDENSLTILRVKAQALATSGRYDDTIEILRKLNDLGYDRMGELTSNIYCLFLKAKSSNLNLDELITIGNISKNVFIFKSFITSLTRNGYYSEALEFLLKYPDLKIFSKNMTEIIISFNKPDCPITLYKTLLENYGHHLYDSYSKLFTNMDFDTAITMSSNIIKKTNDSCVFSSLMNKAFETKSINNINETLNFGLKSVQPFSRNTVNEFVFIPLLLESGLVSEPTAIIELLSQHQQQLTQAFFAYYLCRGDFLSYTALLEKYPTAPQIYKNYSSKNSEIYLNNVSFVQLEQLKDEASKAFDNQFVNFLLRSIIIRRLIASSNNDDVIAIRDAIKMSKRLGVIYSENAFRYLGDKMTTNRELVDELEVNVRMEDKSSLDQSENEQTE